jgi:membrane protease YdiL (CAAX protease family)
MTNLSQVAPSPAAPGLVARHPLVTYFTLAYALTWSVELPLAASAQGWTSWPAPFALHYLAAYGPLLAAVITTWLIDGAAGLRELGARMGHWRVRPVWWAVALSPLLLYVISAVVLRVLRGTWTDVGLLGRINFLPDLGLGAFLLWLLTYGIGEETGWRGFALPRLQRGASALSASLVLAGFWIIWHLPSLLYLPTYVNLGFAVLPWFALGIVAGAVVFTWLYNSTRGSILLVALGHAALNFVTGSPVGEQAIAAAISTAVTVWAVVVILVWKPANLSHAGKEVARDKLIKEYR